MADVTADTRVADARQDAAAAPAEPGKTSPLRRIADLADGQVGVLILAVILIAVVAQSLNPAFLSEGNVIALLRATVTTFIIGCAATFVFTSGGIDLSVGAVFTLGAVASGMLMSLGAPWPLAVAGGLAAGGAVGAINAFMMVGARIPAIIATLSSMYAVSGLALVITGGNPISGLPSGFSDLGQARIGGVPVLIGYAVVVGVVSWLVLSRTRFGYDVQALGGNERAASANGVRVRRIKMQVYVLAGTVAAFAGILYSARTATADPQVGGTDLTLQVIAAVLIGGTSLFGGIGTIPGTALGALLFAEIDNALTVASVNPLLQNIIIGAILALAVAADGWRRSRAFSARGR